MVLRSVYGVYIADNGEILIWTVYNGKEMGAIDRQIGVIGVIGVACAIYNGVEWRTNFSAFSVYLLRWPPIPRVET